jgi:hypothetical protein
MVDEEFWRRMTPILHPNLMWEECDLFPVAFFRCEKGTNGMGNKYSCKHFALIQMVFGWQFPNENDEQIYFWLRSSSKAKSIINGDEVDDFDLLPIFFGKINLWD